MHRRYLPSLETFVQECIAAEADYMAEVDSSVYRFGRVPEVLERLKMRARSLGLWNLFLPADFPGGPGLTNAEYAPLCELSEFIYK